MKLNFFLLKPLHLAIVFAMLSIATPSLTLAASAQPSCTLTVTSPSETIKIKNQKEIFLREGDELKIAWKSTNATKATGSEGEKISLSGATTSTPTTTTTYSYRFTNGSKKALCTITTHVITIQVDTSNVASATSKFTIAGSATGVKTLQIKLLKEGSSKVLFSSNTIKVKNESWKTRVTKKLPNGIYTISVIARNGSSHNVIATSTLSIGVPTKSLTTLIVEPIALLVGGTAHTDETIAISYLQIINIGKNPSLVNGFWIKQNGSASTESITSLSVVDSNGITQGSVSATSGSLLFKNGSAFIPTTASIAPGDMSLFTLKAKISSNVGAHLGKQLKLDISSVETSASVKSTFPIRGTTWTIAP
ncbi:MAG: hypothetical protein WAW13_01685 [Minisyncoccia bacterium]